MKNIQDFLREFEYELTDSDISTLSLEAKKAAINCGKSKLEQVELNSETWSLFDDMSSDLWDRDFGLDKKVMLGFELFETFPNYYHFLVPFYQLIRDKKLENHIELKNIIWSKFMVYLGGEKYYSDTVTYVLWVEFFEDFATVEETWKGLLKYSNNNKSLLILIENAGPVPFELKEPVYYKLLNDKNNHLSIFKSLLHSSFDVYGKFDYNKAELILSKLSIQTDTEHYMLLNEKIKNGLQQHL